MGGRRVKLPVDEGLQSNLPCYHFSQEVVTVAQNPIHVTLSDEATVEFVRRKVASVEYASESDVIQQSVAAFQDQDSEVERWLVEVAGSIFDRMKTDPSSAIPIEQVERHLEERRKRRRETLK